EDGIRDFHVTGVQTCALPICQWPAFQPVESATEPLRNAMNLKQAVKAGAGWCYLHNPLSRRLQAEGVILMLHRVVADDGEAALRSEERRVGEEGSTGRGENDR